MAIVSKPNGDFVNNVDVADATKVNAQMNTIYNTVNGSLDGANVPTLGDVTTVNTKIKSNAVAAINEIVANYPINAMSRQALINANFDVSQRGTSYTNSASGSYTLDRWKLFYTADGGALPTLVYSQQTQTPGDIIGSYYFYRINTNGAGSAFGVNSEHTMYQPIENGTRFLAGLGKKVTVSFWARSSIAGKRLGLRLDQSYGTGGTPSTTEIIVGTIFALTSTWTKYTFTFTTNTLVGKTFGTNNDDTLLLVFADMWGTNIASRYNAGTSESFVGAGNIDIAQVELNAGDAVLPFQPRSFADELQLCQRYYEKSYDYSTAPGTASYPVQNLFVLSISLAASTSGNVSGAGASLPFKVRKRITPAVTLYDFDGTANAVRVYPLDAKRAGVTTVSSLKDTGTFQILSFDASSATAIASSSGIGANWIADAEL